jgi:hypothetical protein
VSVLTFKATLTHWWNVPEYVRDEIEAVRREFRATLDVSDVSKGRAVSATRYYVIGVAIFTLWVPLYLAAWLFALLVGTVNGACKSALPWALYQLRRAIVRVGIIGTPAKPQS